MANRRSPAILILSLLLGGCSPTIKTISWEQLDGPPALSISAILVDQDAPGTLYAGLKTGDLHVSTDGGKSWSSLSPVSPGKPIYQVLKHPEQRSKLFAATGSGLRVSTDKGKTWESSMLVDDPAIKPGCRGIAIDPWQPITMYSAVDDHGIFVSTDGGNSWKPTAGNLSPGEINGGSVDQITIHPAKPDALFAIVSTLGLLGSTDAGKSWAILTESFGIGEVEISRVTAHPSDPDILCIGTSGGDIYKSTDMGEVWSLVRQGSGYSPVLSFASVPDQDDHLYAATDAGVLTSSDFGTSWSDAGESFPPTIGTLLVGSDAAGTDLYLYGEGTGFEKSTDSGATWQGIGSGLSGSTVTSITLTRSGDAAYTAIGSGVYRFAADSGWTNASAGLPGSLVTGIALDGNSDSRLYASTLSGPYETSDKGEHWEPLGKSIGGTPFSMMAAHPSIGNRLFAETPNGVLFSTDRGTSWNRPKPPLIATGVSPIAFHPANAGIIAAGTAEMSAVTSKDGGLTWDESPYGIDAAEILAVTFSHDTQENYFAWSRDGRGFSTTNNGIEWKEVETPWTNVRTILVAFDHFVPSSVMILVNGTSLYHSTTGGESWIEITIDPSHVEILTLSWDHETSILYSGTFNKGMQRLRLGKEIEKALKKK